MVVSYRRVFIEPTDDGVFVTTAHFGEAGFYCNYVRVHSSHGPDVVIGASARSRGQDRFYLRARCQSARARQVEEPRDLKVLGKRTPMESSPPNVVVVVVVGRLVFASCSALVSEIDLVRRLASLTYSSLT